ncbi:hypothetical protein Fleli_1450 [Bernardetia litoralis DSM 6794]|uniref:Uncharacterized protein n=1 Tax=Bernardetia litoralis (strain ATCC 23117 / DSM 6794 / NBRC 15988 / NCIMB 1366 / Fx l1 / Sio-4) TaxID=880071 RepID=I4AIU1_BERLS|nr:hypothetical protein Fleli_1450 [Bernardetia litoralis DSM 6794]
MKFIFFNIVLFNLLLSSHFAHAQGNPVPPLGDRNVCPSSVTEYRVPDRNNIYSAEDSCNIGYKLGNIKWRNSSNNSIL